MANEFFHTGGTDVAITLTPGESGVLQVIADGEMLFDKMAEGEQHPDLNRVKLMKAAIKEKLAEPVAADD